MTSGVVETAGLPLHPGDVTAVLLAGGVPEHLVPDLALALERALGEDAGPDLAADPWRLLDVTWVRPEQADSFARGSLGSAADPEDPRRRRALVTWLLVRAALDGHTTVAASTVLGALRGLGIAEPEAALAAVVADGAVLAVDCAGALHLALDRWAAAEDAVAEGVARLVATARHLCGPDVLARLSVPAAPDPSPEVALRAAAVAGLSVAVTRTAAAAGRAVAALGGLAGAAGVPMCLVAPTARAARAWRASGAVGADVAITTVSGLTDRAPARGLVVVTEAALPDAEAAAALLEALPDGTHLVLLGDPGGLAGPGPGDVFADLAACPEVPTSVVAGPGGEEPGAVLARLAAGVAAGVLPEPEAGREVVLVPARDDGEAAHRVVQLVTDSIPRALGIAASDVLVVTPRRRGGAGADALDARLRAALGGAGHAGLAAGDRVVATDPERAFPAYGEPAVVRSVAEREVVLEVAGAEARVPAYAAGLRPGRAVTPREALGATWPAVVLVLPGESAGSLSRDLLATAIGRAQRHLSVVHAVGPALPAAVAGRARRTRSTRLPGLLAELLADDEPVDP